MIRYFEDLGCITALNVGYLAQNVDFIVSFHLLSVFQLFLLHILSRNIRDYWETVFSGQTAGLHEIKALLMVVVMMMIMVQ